MINLISANVQIICNIQNHGFHLILRKNQQIQTRLRDDVQKKNGKISDIEQKGGRGVESISLFLTY